ncbi:MAG: septal ring lytic transglycosylase RlpA family protein [Nitrospirota bacterium]
MSGNQDIQKFSLAKVKVVSFFVLLLLCCFSVLAACATVTIPYTVTKGAIKGSIWVLKGTYELTAGTTKILYKIGEFTFEVVRAPLEWPLFHDEIDNIDGLPAKEAICLGRVKNSPYTVKGKTYYPMSLGEAKGYNDTGIASWYGYETLKQRGGFMTANGEIFNPQGLTAAHKYLPLPIHVKVTNLENQRSIIVRVNDRGPFPTDENPKSGDRIIDLSAGAAKRLGFFEKGTAKVKVEVIHLESG